MSGLLGKVARLARSPQGQRAVRQATQYARSEKGRQQLAAARQRLAGGRRRRPPS